MVFNIIVINYQDNSSDILLFSLRMTSINYWISCNNTNILEFCKEKKILLISILLTRRLKNGFLYFFGLRNALE